jgi:hypothetical protein
VLSRGGEVYRFPGAKEKKAKNSQCVVSALRFGQDDGF